MTAPGWPFAAGEMAQRVRTHDWAATALVETTRRLGEHLGASRVLYAEVHGDDWLVAKGYEQGVMPLPEGRYAARTYGAWIMRDFRAGQGVVVHDARRDARFPAGEREAHAAIQTLATIGVPLVKGGRLVAVLAVHAAAPRDWDLATGRVVWSEEHYRMQGYVPGEVEPSYAAWLARV